jgi:hypothetical protein
MYTHVGKFKNDKIKEKMKKINNKKSTKQPKGNTFKFHFYLCRLKN